ncbi:MAG: hypothetical protein Q4A82_00880 [Corynebacterium sp.]|nr:hypothetical protein [Corynebacterium sp.]
MHSAVLALRLLLRDRRFFLLAWLIPLTLYVVTMPGTYTSSYPDAASLAAVGASVQNSLGLVVLYGKVPDPFTYASWTVWEVMAWGLILSAIMGLFLGSSTSRGVEENGQAELLQSTGLSARALRLLSLAAVVAISAVWGLCVALSLWANVLLTEEFTPGGSSLTGYCAFLATAFFGIVAIIAGEAFGSMRAARQVTLLVLAVSFGLRVVADVYDVAWLRWLTPLGWPGIINPFTDNRWQPALIFTLFIAVLTVPVAASRRDMYSQWVQVAAGVRRTAGWGSWTFWWKLHGTMALWWSVAIVIISAGFYAMTGEMNDLFKNSPGTAEILTKLAPTQEMMDIYAQMMAKLVGLLVCCMAVQLVLTLHKSERQGFATLLLSTGQSRITLFMQNFLYTLVTSAILLVVTAVLSGYAGTVDSRVPADQFEPIVWSVIDMIPSVVVCCGFASLLMGLRVNITGLAWAPVAISGFISFFGEMMKLDKWVLDSSVFAWAPHTVDHYRGAAVLLALGLSTLALGLVGFKNRDLTG